MAIHRIASKKESKEFAKSSRQWNWVPRRRARRWQKIYCYTIYRREIKVYSTVDILSCDSTYTGTNALMLARADYSEISKLVENEASEKNSRDLLARVTPFWVASLPLAFKWTSTSIFKNVPPTSSSSKREEGAKIKVDRKQITSRYNVIVPVEKLRVPRSRSTDYTWKHRIAFTK